jgi:hypothetical protein
VELYAKLLTLYIVVRGKTQWDGALHENHVSRHVQFQRE